MLNELNNYIDKVGYLVIKDCIQIPAKIIEAKITFGKVRILVRPIVGNGIIWLNVNNNKNKSVKFVENLEAINYVNSLKEQNWINKIHHYND